jgi:hypothetical protein
VPALPCSRLHAVSTNKALCLRACAPRMIVCILMCIFDDQSIVIECFPGLAHHIISKLSRTYSNPRSASELIDLFARPAPAKCAPLALLTTSSLKGRAAHVSDTYVPDPREMSQPQRRARGEDRARYMYVLVFFILYSPCPLCPSVLHIPLSAGFMLPGTNPRGDTPTPLPSLF